MSTRATGRSLLLGGRSLSGGTLCTRRLCLGRGGTDSAVLWGRILEDVSVQIRPHTYPRPARRLSVDCRGADRVDRGHLEGVTRGREGLARLVHLFDFA